jgi:hypothetical protein
MSMLQGSWTLRLTYSFDGVSMLQKNVCGVIVLGSYKSAFEICCYIIKSTLFKSNLQQTAEQVG